LVAYQVDKVPVLLDQQFHQRQQGLYRSLRSLGSSQSSPRRHAQSTLVAALAASQAVGRCLPFGLTALNPAKGEDPPSRLLNSTEVGSAGRRDLDHSVSLLCGGKGG
jgi:hypothetical protein